MAKKELSDVDELVSSLNKELGEGSIMNFGDDKPIISIPRESTGSLVVDKALGGGWAVGRIHELVGMESCGKTMMCTLSMIEFQKKHPDKLVAIIDVENAFDIEYARKMGLDIKRIRKEITEPRKKATINKAVIHQNRIKFHAQTNVTPLMCLPTTDFLAWVQILSRTINSKSSKHCSVTPFVPTR